MTRSPQPTETTKEIKEWGEDGAWRKKENKKEKNTR
jgi:hypothetical protein